MRILGIEGEQISFEKLPISGVDCGNSAHGIPLEPVKGNLAMLRGQCNPAAMTRPMD
jgi:hypothetical protein